MVIQSAWLMKKSETGDSELLTIIDIYTEGQARNVFAFANDIGSDLIIFFHRGISYTIWEGDNGMWYQITHTEMLHYFSSALNSTISKH